MILSGGELSIIQKTMLDLSEAIYGLVYIYSQLLSLVP